jgi:prepilin-type processing-associated H-X9-DG protein
VVVEDVDLTEWPGYTPNKPGYRHAEQAVVGWLDGHVKPHRESFVSRREDFEEGVQLFGNDRLVHWNLR